MPRSNADEVNRLITRLGKTALKNILAGTDQPKRVVRRRKKNAAKVSTPKKEAK